MQRVRNCLLPCLLIGFTVAHALFSLQIKNIRAEWANVPPVPSEAGIHALFLGDSQLAYRVISLMLQNFGNIGGRVEKFEAYNYNNLEKWFFLADRLDPVSNYAPMLAAYYFSYSKDPRQVEHLVNYLAIAGNRPEGEKWRWLAQAVYLARYGQKDMDRALELANRLAELWQPGRPAWMKQMPALIATAQGDKEAAYNIMMSILQGEAEKMHPEEVRYMVDHICDKILEPAQANEHPLCIQR